MAADVMTASITSYITFKLGDDLESIVVSLEGQNVGLAGDRFAGSESVIEPIDSFYRSVDLFTAVTLLGGDRVAMVLDLAGVLRAGHDDRASSLTGTTIVT
jgi:chemotaxis protein histidine kinase CheA